MESRISRHGDLNSGRAAVVRLFGFGSRIVGVSQGNDVVGRPRCLPASSHSPSSGDEPTPSGDDVDRPVFPRGRQPAPGAPAGRPSSSRRDPTTLASAPSAPAQHARGRFLHGRDDMAPATMCALLHRTGQPPCARRGLYAESGHSAGDRGQWTNWPSTSQRWRWRSLRRRTRFDAGQDN